ncbi:MAG: helix-turn-helix domain-containing protein [Lachnospiraceae bacterium]
MIKILILESSERIRTALENMRSEIEDMELFFCGYDCNEIWKILDIQSISCIAMELTPSVNVWSIMDEVKSRIQMEFLLFATEKNFSDAYQAFQHRAFHFFTEPVDRDQLTLSMRELERIQSEHLQRKKDRQRIELIELKQQQQLMERILVNVLEKPIELEMMLSEFNQRYQTKITNDTFQVLLIHFNRKELFAIHSTFISKLNELMHVAFPYASQIIDGSIQSYGFTSIINLKEGDTLEYRKEDVQKLYLGIEALQESYGSFEFIIAVGIPILTMKAINESLQEALRVEKYKLVEYENRIYFASRIRDHELTLSDIITTEQRKGIVHSIKTMDAEGVSHWITRFLKELNANYFNLPNTYLLLKDYLIFVCQQEYSEADRSDCFLPFEEELLEMDYIFSGTQLLIHLKEVILKVMEQRRHEYQKEYSDVIAMAVKYIDTNFQNSITLEETSLECGLSPNYFSAVFKQEVGMNYIEYLTSVRLTAAKEMLLTTDKGIRDIAEAVGYIDDKYFSKIFKQRFDITPGKFRKNRGDK